MALTNWSSFDIFISKTPFSTIDMEIYIGILYFILFIRLHFTTPLLFVKFFEKFSIEM